MKEIARQFFEAAHWLREAASKLSFRHDKAPIDTVDRVCHFARTRAALITQKKLYGYLKERMGTRYPKMFDDEVFAQSITTAKLEVYAASLADLTCFCVARSRAGQALGDDDGMDFARRCYRLGIEENTAEAAPDRRAAWLTAFDGRLAATVWSDANDGGPYFVESPKALIRWAPIADELKKYDREIVENSIRFAWLEVCTDFLQRLDAGAVARDLQAGRVT